jgi:hypothetical protein
MEELANTGKNVAWLSETGIDPGGYHMVLPPPEKHNSNEPPVSSMW